MVFSVTYYSELHKAILFSKNVKTYQVKSFMWYNNTRTTYLIFVDQKTKSMIRSYSIA
jgi:hypothetical protein